MPKLYSAKQMEPATPAQINFINSLADQLGFDETKKIAHIQDLLEDEGKSTFNLRKWEAGLVIDAFKGWKEKQPRNERQQVMFDNPDAPVDDWDSLYGGDFDDE